MKQLNRRKKFGKVRTLFGAAALFLLLGVILPVQPAQAANEKATLRKTENYLANRDEWEKEKGYHLGAVAETLAHPHRTGTDDRIIECQVTGLKPTADQVKNGKSDPYGIIEEVSIDTRQPVGTSSDKVSSVVYNARVGGKWFNLAGPYVCPDGYAAYATFRQHFSHCTYTGKDYFVASSHYWLGCAQNHVGKPEFHPTTFSHNIYKYYIEPNTYTVVFNKNGGKGTMADQSMVYGTAENLNANKFTRTGYHFTGWNTKKDGSGTAYADKKSVKNLTSKDKGTVTLYAQWEVNSLKLRYHANGGTAKSGYTLSNQIVQKDGKTLEKTIRYTTKTMDLTNVGTLLTRSDYKVDGAAAWCMGSPTGTAVSHDKDTAIPTELKNILKTKNGEVVTLYANWKNDPHKLTVKPNGGTWNGSASDQTFVLERGEQKTIPNPIWTGHKFTWSLSGAGSTLSGQTFTMGTADAVLTANWTAYGYNIRFNGNGAAEGTMADQQMTYDVIAPLNANSYLKPGYTFVGWNTRADGTGTAYRDKQSVVNLTETDGATVTLYAQWVANTYSIHFDGNGATEGTMADIEAEYDKEITLPENVFKRTTDQGDSLFLGWAKNPEVHEPEFADKETIQNLSEENGTVVILYAVWDDCPEIKAVDRYFTLKAAQEGKITEEELLSTASATDREDNELENRTSGQIAESGINGSLSLYGYQTTDFTEMTDSGSVSMTYKAVDSAGNTVYETVTVFITNTEPLPQTEFSYTRFINEKYYGASYENGGLHEKSVWRKDPAYKLALQKALSNLKNNTPEVTFTFTSRD